MSQKKYMLEELYEKDNIEEDNLKSLEVFSGVIAHEFSNLLSGIQAWAQIGQKEKDVKNISRAFKSINEACEKGTSLAKSLLNFSRSRELITVPVNINKLIDETINLLAAQFKKKNISIKKEYTPIEDIMLDKAKIYQVFLNILINAKDAITSDNGIIEIHTSKKDNIVQILFSDNGCGISKENLKNIFKPFFSTKKNPGSSGTSGTGLGLSITRDIIRYHRGEIMVESIEGSGTKFYILLPVEHNLIK